MSKSKELLRITMGAAQVRQACEEWARDRTDSGEWTTTATGVPDETIVTVVFTAKRIRKKAKAAAP